MMEPHQIGILPKKGSREQCQFGPACMNTSSIQVINTNVTVSSWNFNTINTHTIGLKGYFRTSKHLIIIITFKTQQ